MRYLALFGLVVVAGCNDVGMGGFGGGTGGGNGGTRELMVLGSNMSFEECQSRGGLIIRDANTPMVACDPRVVRQVQPADEDEFVVIEEG